MKHVIVIKESEKQYPLYTATLEGAAYDGSDRYEMVIITQWTDRTKNAKEVCHKVYYFESDRYYLQSNLTNEEWCANIFASFKEYSKIMIERRVDLHAKNN